MTAANTAAETPHSRLGDHAGHPARGRTGVRKYATRLAIGVAVIAVLGLGAVAGVNYWTAGRFIETTDDAYVQADSTIVAPRVSGYIRDLLVTDNQHVRAGQTLARIDERDLRNALDDAKASLAAANATVASLDAQLAAQGALIRQADASTAAAAASLSLSQRNDARLTEMARVGYGSVEQADDATTDVKEQAATLQRLQAAAVEARQQVSILTAQRMVAQAQVAHAQASEHQAQLNLSYTAIVAPIDGTVGARSLRVGQYVQAGTQLMALVPLRQVYVIANYKETQLTHVHPGQPAPGS
jgi:membrane fusion protein (multidrug efflux system)